jgi:hypothetical protein
MPARQSSLIVQALEEAYMVTGIGVFPWLVVLAIAIIPFWQIFKKAGFSPALSLLMIIPIINVVMVFYLAFATWPIYRQLQR